MAVGAPEQLESEEFIVASCRIAQVTKERLDFSVEAVVVLLQKKVDLNRADEQGRNLFILSVEQANF